MATWKIKVINVHYVPKNIFESSWNAKYKKKESDFIPINSGLNFDITSDLFRVYLNTQIFSVYSHDLATRIHVDEFLYISLRRIFLRIH